MITIEPVGFVRNERKEPVDDYWGDIVSEIILAENIPPESLKGIDDFSHLEIIFHFHLAGKKNIDHFTSHPRNNPEYPEVGIFAQRRKSRPNLLGCTIVKLLDVKGNILKVSGLDAIDGTPVIDIKPVIKEFLPTGEVLQPVWVTRLMKDYFKNRG
jgi:tRNA-Thr(GGU) m(6)t(6)A37 methyltransferase TsaA